MAQAVAHLDASPSVPPEMIARIVEVLHPEQVWLFGMRPSRTSTLPRCGSGSGTYGSGASRCSR
ncbi:MAG TPA: hypothetical protein VF516_00675 [Kofleriaceae bacterium]